MSTVLDKLRPRVRRAAADTLVGLGIGGLTMVCLALFLVTGYFTALFVIGIGAVMLPIVMPAVRWVCDLSRRTAERSGVPVERPYQPEPQEFERDIVGWMRRCKWILTDRATWRDLLWLLLNTGVGMVGFLPAALLYYAGEGFALAGGLWRPLYEDDGSGRMYALVTIESPLSAFAAAGMAVGVLAFWVWATPTILKGHAYFTRFLLGPTGHTRLVDRVRHLDETRSGALDIQAAELRRIERDLHDGAQARLVSLGFKLGAADRYLGRDEEEVRRLLVEARQSSVAALRELRDLVHGIHPPVLAERGLADALRALCLASPLPVDVSITIPGRPAAPVESAVYFTVSELLTNVLKHAEATKVDLVAWHEDDVLYARVTDDGKGGADISKGRGLDGVRRRLATFDGAMELVSPPGGPTVTKLEIPCVLSSWKTSSS